jgi:hypothetical protein
MARIISDKQITHTAIQSYLKQAVNDYTVFLDKAPVFVTYYSKNHLLSSSNESLNSVANIFGEDSPIKYNKIENTPLWSISGVSLSTDIGVFGQEADVNGDALLIPETISPCIDDVFTIFHDGSDTYYRINNIEYSILKGKRYAKIQFHLTADIDDADMIKQVADEYSMVADNSSPTKFRTLRISTAELLADFQLLQDKLQDTWVKQFCKNQYDIPAVRQPDGTYFYDYGMGEFIKAHRLLARERDYRENLTYIPLDVPDIYYATQMEKSIFALLETDDLSEFKQAYVTTIPIGEMNPTSNVHHWRDTFLISWDYTDTPLPPPDFGSLPCYSETLKEYLEDTDGTVLPIRVEDTALKLYRSKAKPEDIFDVLKDIGGASNYKLRGVDWYYYGVLALFITNNMIQALKNESISG